MALQEQGESPGSRKNRKVDSLKTRIAKEKDERRKAVQDLKEFRDFPDMVEETKSDIKRITERIKKYEKEVDEIENGIEGGTNLTNQFKSCIS